jgi:limonene-1,2-epoxide hydrolase
MTPLDTVNEFIRLVCAKQLDEACALLTDDVEYDNVPMGKNHGPDAVKALLSGMLGDLQVEFITHREAATGNIVMNERTDRFIIGDKQHDILVMGVFELTDDGKIRLWRDYFDMGSVQALMADLGAG